MDPEALWWPWTECAQLTGGIGAPPPGLGKSSLSPRPSSQQALGQGLASYKKGPQHGEDRSGGHHAATVRALRGSLSASWICCWAGEVFHQHSGLRLWVLVQPPGTGQVSSQAGPWTCWVGPSAPLPCESPMSAMRAEVAGADLGPGTEGPVLGDSTLQYPTCFSGRGNPEQPLVRAVARPAGSFLMRLLATQCQWVIRSYVSSPCMNKRLETQSRTKLCVALSLPHATPASAHVWSGSAGW